jgi:hypothetical protein
VLLIGAGEYPLAKRSARLLRGLIRQTGHQRPLSYLADVLGEDVDTGDSPEPVELGRGQIAELCELLSGVQDEPLAELRAGCERFVGEAEPWNVPG